MSIWPWSNDSTDNREEIELTKVTWEERVMREYEYAETKIVWSGGAEKTVTHCPRSALGTGSPGAFFDEDGKVVFECNKRPAYTEQLDTWTKEREETIPRSAWIEGDIPNGVSVTDTTKTVIQE